MSTVAVARQSTGWIPSVDTFGARLALIRQQKGWSNIAMAARACGVPVDSWRNWEVDGREPHRMTVVGKQIASASGVDYLWLVHGPDRGEGGLNARLSPLTEKVIGRRQTTKPQPNSRPRRATTRPASPVHPTRRRARELRSPNRPELAA